MNPELLTLDRSQLNSLLLQAREHPMRRSRILLHKDHDAAVQEMCIVLFNGSILPPHRQRNKQKSYWVIEGSMDLGFYDFNGGKVRSVRLSGGFGDHPSVIRFDAGVWHTPIAESEWVAFLEIIQGPYDPNQTEWICN
jgi:cupin fold WbuC family metalloprotein